MVGLGALGSLLLAGGCGGGGPVITDPGPALPPELPRPTVVDSIFQLESGGTPPDDTTVAIDPAAGRVIILRRGAPDHSLFARLTVPPGIATGGDSVRLTLRPRPGLYGIDLEVDGQLGAGAELTMSYAVHFVAPEGARDRYGSDLGFERALFLVQLTDERAVTFLPTTRPGSDLVTATLPGPGRYLVAAPRS